MKKVIILCPILIILLTSCVQVKKIDYTSYSTSFNQTNQDDNSKMLDEIYYSSIYIQSPKDFDNYVNNLDNLSNSSYESVKNADYLTYEDIEREIKFQKDILNLLGKLTVQVRHQRPPAYSEYQFHLATTYKNVNIKKLVETRINYFEVISTDIERSSITTETKLFQIENVTLPLLASEAERTRTDFLENF